MIGGESVLEAMSNLNFSVALAEGTSDEPLGLAHLDEAKLADDMFCRADDDRVVLAVVKGKITDLAVAVQQLERLIRECLLGFHLNNNSL